jgi:predicted lipoprotein with Yx(FWY)xxD motif
MRKLCLAGVAGLALVAVTVAAATSQASTASGVVISTRKVPGLGAILVNAQGRTLYMFVRDKQTRVTCVGTCAAVWPPVKLRAGAKAVAMNGAKASLLGSDRDPAGGRVVTYAKWPLYTYVADTKAGATMGQALNLNGGLWYVLSPSGKVIKAKVRRP